MKPPKPPAASIDDDVLGRVTRERGGDEWQAAFALSPGRTIELDCTADDGPTAVALLRLAVAWLPVGDPAARRYAATTNLELFNDTWRDPDDDPEPITHAEFARRLTLWHASVSDDGSLMLSYGAGGMFTEHGFTVDVDADGNFTDAGMQ